MEEVIKLLKALSSGFGKQDADMLVGFYNVAYEQLGTEEEQEAFRQGSLAMFADIGNLRLRRIYHTYLFRRAVKRLQKANGGG